MLPRIRKLGYNAIQIMAIQARLCALLAAAPLVCPPKRVLPLRVRTSRRALHAAER